MREWVIAAIWVVVVCGLLMFAANLVTGCSAARCISNTHACGFN